MIEGIFKTKEIHQSATIAQLALALSKAQGVMEGAAKDSANPFFKSKYADLASVWDACRGPLSENELAVVQIPVDGDLDGKVAVITTLMHSSGEWISGRLSLTPVKSDPQGVGSAITYARRYGLQAIVGIAPEDDDGNAASRPDKPKDVPVIKQDIEIRGSAQSSGDSPTSQRKGREVEAPKPTVPDGRHVSPGVRPVSLPDVKAEEAVLDPVSSAPAAKRDGGQIASNPGLGSGTGEAGGTNEAFSAAPAPTEMCSREAQDWLRLQFKEALPAKYQVHADQMRRDFLKTLGYKDERGVGTSKAIPALVYKAVVKDCIAHAKSFIKLA